MEEENNDKKLKSWFNKFSTQLLVFLMILIIVIVYFSDTIFVSIRAGEEGVLFRTFNGGTELDHTYGEGVHAIFPWDEMAIYNGRIQLIKDTVVAISMNGVMVKVYYSVNYRPIMDSLGYLHKNVGPDYVNVVIIPESSAAVLEIFSQQNPEQLYSADRNELQKTILSKLKREVGERYIKFIDILIEDIILPEKVKGAIENKFVKRQEELSYEHILGAQEKEIERMKLEALGIKKFEEISEIPFLKFRGLQATEALATSKNAKVVIMGNSEQSLPIILGNDNK